MSRAKYSMPGSDGTRNTERRVIRDRKQIKDQHEVDPKTVCRISMPQLSELLYCQREILRVATRRT